MHPPVGNSLGHAPATASRAAAAFPRCLLFDGDGRYRAFLRKALLLLFGIAFSSSQLLGIESSVADLRVIHESWSFKDGAPGNVAALAQTSDGFLWLGTSTGLFRFDGTRFERYRSPFGEEFLSDKILSLYAPESGGLWIGYNSGGFSFLNNGRVTNYGGQTAMMSGNVGGFALDRNRLLWAGTSSGLWRFDHSSWQRIGAEWNSPQGRLFDIGADASGIIWVLSRTPSHEIELSYLLPGNKKFQSTKVDLPVAGFRSGPDGKVITSVRSKQATLHGTSRDERLAYPVFGTNCVQIADRRNSVWSLFPDTALLRNSGTDSSQDVSRKNAQSYDVFPSRARLVDRDDNVWFGDRTGLHRFFYSPFTKQELPVGSAADSSFSVAAARDGAVWISVVSDAPRAQGADSTSLYLTSGGAAELQKTIPGGSWISYRAPDGTLWFDGAGAIWHFVNGKLERVELPHEMANEAIFWQVITQDRTGAVWVSFSGAPSTAELYRLANGHWTHYGGRHDLPKGRITTEFTDNLGRIWFGYRQSVLAVLGEDRLHVFREDDGLRVGDITVIYGRGSKIWIGGELGLQEVDHGYIHSIKAVDDEWLRGITGIVETAKGDLWINGLSGVFHIRSSDISLALKDPAYRVTGEHFSRREGVPGPLAMISHPNTAVEGTDGRLWFFGSDGVVWLSPSQVDTRVPAPRVAIQSIAADDKVYPLGQAMRMPAHTASVQIDYAAIDLSAPDAVRFRYKLREVDKDWNEVSTTRSSSYRRLAPGVYHFSVEAKDINGTWPSEPTTVEFTILAAFYQTGWFTFLCVVALLGLVWLAMRYRMNHVASVISERAEVRVEERVRIARDLHDTLLQSIQGLILQFHVATQELPATSRTRQAMERALVRADQLVAEGRDRVNRLRSDHFTHTDLVDAFEGIADDLNEGEEIQFALKIEGRVKDIAPPLLNELLYIGREAITNAFRHSDASEIRVHLVCNQKSVTLSVVDNGHGFDPIEQERNRTAGHWGLLGMKERAKVIGAKLRCTSAPASGTTICLTVPAASAYKRESKANRMLIPPR